jgi:hypothetical protein
MLIAARTVDLQADAGAGSAAWHRVLPHELVVRDSTAAPATRPDAPRTRQKKR